MSLPSCTRSFALRDNRSMPTLALTSSRASVDKGVRIGALVTMAEAAEHLFISLNYPLVAQSLTSAASQQIRNMATMGGNILQRTRCPYFRDISYAQCNKREPRSGCAAREGINRQHAILATSDDCVATYPGDFAQALIAIGGA